MYIILKYFLSFSATTDILLYADLYQVPKALVQVQVPGSQVQYNP